MELNQFLSLSSIQFSVKKLISEANWAAYYCYRTSFQFSFCFQFVSVLLSSFLLFSISSIQFSSGLIHSVQFCSLFIQFSSVHCSFSSVPGTVPVQFNSDSFSSLFVFPVQFNSVLTFRLISVLWNSVLFISWLISTQFSRFNRIKQSFDYEFSSYFSSNYQLV